jgi:hypothetical protein
LHAVDRRTDGVVCKAKRSFVTEAQFAEFGLTFGVTGFMLYMLFIIFQLARGSKAGKFGTFVLF